MWALLLLAAGCAGVAPPCEGWSAPERLGALDDPSVTEVSGLVASRAHPGVLWAHEDGDGVARVLALDETGHVLGAVELPGPEVTDPEDIALHEGVLVLADVGDNDLARDALRLLRVPEPDPAGGGVAVVSEQRFTLPDGPADIEAVLVDADGAALLIEKSGGDPRAWRLAPGEDVATALGRVALDGAVVTGADRSPDGALILLRTWEGVLAYAVEPGQSAWHALSGAPCLAPTAREDQGEAVAATDDGFLTMSEGQAAPLWRTLRGM